MADIFKDIIPSILQTKKPVLDNEKDYVPFVINKALAHHYDCIFYANQMNIHCQIDRKMQYDLLLNTIRPYKRPYQKWQKMEEVENLDAVKEFFNFSNEKAKAALCILTDDQISEIKKELNKGGVQNVNINRRSD